MGIGSYDVTGDGYPEVYLTSQGDNRLQTLLDGPARPTYQDIGLKRGVDAAQPFTGGDALPSTAWHAEFQDVNNDGFIDLFVSKGNVGEQPDHAMKDPSNLFIGQPDGTFVEGAEAAGILSFARGRGAALADLNLDGLPDLVEVNYRDQVALWRNVGSGDAADARRRWATGSSSRPSQPGPNRDAIGAWIEVKVGDDDPAPRADRRWRPRRRPARLDPCRTRVRREQAQVRVMWPDGEVGPWLDATRRHVRHHRARRDRHPALGSTEGLTSHADRPRPPRRDRPARLRDARRRARTSRPRSIRARLDAPARARWPRAATTGSSSTPTASTAPTCRT